MVCPACQRVPHNSKPEDCQGGTWCDCQHKWPIEVKTMNEESTTSNKLIDTESGTNV